jgi:membrane protein required for colicin V production
MNWFDVALIALFAVSIASGIRQGISRSGFGFLAAVIAFLAAAWLFPANPAGFLILFAVLIAAGILAAFLLGRFFKGAGLKWVDRVLGGAFGLANASILAVIAVLAIMAFAPKFPRQAVAHSTFAPFALNAAHDASEVLPEEMKSRVKGSYGELMNLLPPKLRKAVPSLPRNI